MKRRHALDYLERELASLDAAGLLRRRGSRPASTKSFASNDYLGLARYPAPPSESGAGASRLVSGDRSVHQDLERVSAELVACDAALVFTSGYAANLGLVSALAGAGDLIVSDALNHASLIDGARLSRARVAVVPHLDADAVRRALADRGEARAFVLTESYFSMDADGPDLRRLRSICDETDAALIVDESHALGVFGPDGRGLCVASHVKPDALVGTYGKAFGAGGAFVAGPRVLIEWLWNRARSLVFSTALAPPTSAAALAGVERARLAPELRARVLANAERFRGALRNMGLRVPGYGPIVPWILGDPAVAIRVAAALNEKGIDAVAIRPPSVPVGTARIRLTVTAEHSDDDLAVAETAIREVAPCLLPSS